MPGNPRYTGYQYETSPRKLEPEYMPKKNPYKGKKKSVKKVPKTDTKKQRKQNKAVKQKKKGQFRVLCYVAIGFIILFAISYRNSMINESFNKVQNMKKDLAAIQKENQQTQVSIENNLNLSALEQEAKERLGMQKLNNQQSVYVSLPKKDYVEAASEEVIMNNNQNWFQKIISAITGK